MGVGYPCVVRACVACLETGCGVGERGAPGTSVIPLRGALAWRDLRPAVVRCAWARVFGVRAMDRVAALWCCDVPGNVYCARACANAFANAEPAAAPPAPPVDVHVDVITAPVRLTKFDREGLVPRGCAAGDAHTVLLVGESRYGVAGDARVCRVRRGGAGGARG